MLCRTVAPNLHLSNQPCTLKLTSSKTCLIPEVFTTKQSRPFFASVAMIVLVRPGLGHLRHIIFTSRYEGAKKPGQAYQNSHRGGGMCVSCVSDKGGSWLTSTLAGLLSR